MDLEQFYAQTKEIVLHPGNIDELNKIEILANSGREYELMPIRNGKTYITGIILPNKEDLKDSMKMVQAGLGVVQNLDGGLGMDFDGELDGATGMLEELIKGISENPAMMEMDIRMKAKEMGANGLVHVKLYSKEGSHMGVPIKLK